MKFNVPHNTTQAAAIRRVQKLLEEHKSQIAEQASDVVTSWNDNVLTFSFTAQGTHISGTVTITDTHFDVYAKLPLMYRLFEGKIEKMIQAEIAKIGM